MQEFKPTILYVEDDDGIRNQLVKFLKYFSTKLITAKDGQEGLELYKKYLPDIVISDIKMPKMNGIEMVKLIKNINPKQYIIFTTAHSESNYFLDALDMQVYAYILKPINLDQLEIKIETIRESINQKNELENYNNRLEERVKEEILKQKKQEHILLQQSKLAQMGEMISMIAHQWRQPLTAISSTITNIDIKLEIGKFDFEDKEDRKLFLKFLEKKHNNIINYIKNMSDTIDDFRTFFKPNKERTETTYDELVKSTLSIIEMSIKNNNIKLILDLNCNKPINIYENDLKQVLINLIQNAKEILLERKIENPTIKITASNEVITISDNAQGVPIEIIDKIFEPYFSTKDKKGGTGLGLYMSKMIIEDHCNGKLTVSNNSNGAVFKIYIPLDS